MTESPPALMHLVDDEVITLPVRGDDQDFRLRIWRAKGVPACVLITQVRGQKPPNVISAKLANRAYETYLRFHEKGMDYYESYGGRCYLVTFGWFGCGERKKLFRPDRHEVPMSDISILVGAVVE